jgi:hypothetical protein
MSVNLTKEDFFKSIEKLQELKKAQICQGSGNEPQNWPGGKKKEEGNNWTDNISPNATDYVPGSKARKSIQEKIEKGESLTEADLELLKGDIERNDIAAKKEAEAAAKEDAKDDKGPMNKSMAASIEQNDDLQKAIEVSDFLSDFAKSFADGLQGVEARNTEAVGQLATSINELAELQKSYNVALGDGISTIVHGMAALMEGKQAAQELPAHAPKSEVAQQIPAAYQPPVYQPPQQQGFAPFQKSQHATDQMNKKVILDAMVDLVYKGQIDKLEVAKFEVGDQISQHTLNLVQKSLS